MSRRRVAALLVVVGLAALAHPLYLFPHHGQSPVFVHQFDELGSERPAGDVVAYDDLPPKSQRALDAARDGESYRLWHGDDDAAIDPLESGQYLERDGAYYQFDTAHRGGVVWGFGTAIRVLLTALGSLALVVGLLVARTDSLRPLAPRRALAVPVIGAVGILATSLYDVSLSGASESFWMAAEGFGAVALVGVSLAAAARRRDARNAKIAVGVALAASAVLLVGLGASPIFGAIVGVPTLASSLVLGFMLTDPEGVPSADYSL